MKITHINFAKGFRGGERQTQLLLEQLSDQGLKQTLLTRVHSELAQRCKHIYNLTIREVPKPYIFHLNLSKPTDLIHAHETKGLQFAYAASIFNKTSFIVTRRVDNRLKTNFLNTKMYKAAFRSVALSNAIKNEIMRISPQAKTTIIPSAYSDTKVNKIESNKIKSRFHGKFLIGNVGALVDSHKGQSFLIEAAKELEKSHPNVHFILLGRGEDEAKFKAQAKGLNNITFEGFVDNVNDYINCFDLFVFPSRHEGLGSILFDVMQLNVPIIATKVGGIPDIIQDGINGILIPPLSKNSILDKIKHLQQHPELSESLVVQARDIVTQFSPENMAKRYIKLYSHYMQSVKE